MNWKLTLAYDGTDFFGWQVQPDRVTLQGTLADAIARVTGERVLPQGSGRTDAGVHARGQVASFALNAPIPADNLLRALNRKLPEAIRVLAAEPAPPEFHARHSARAKTYEYRIDRAEICPPWRARFAWALHWPLDPSRMQAAAPAVIGAHDFTSFAAFDPDRTARDAGDEDETLPALSAIFARSFTPSGGRTARPSSTASAATVSSITWSATWWGPSWTSDAGTSNRTRCGRILQARARHAAGPTAPARGLFLDSVEY